MKESVRHVLHIVFLWLHGTLGVMYALMFKSNASWFDAKWLEVSSYFIKSVVWASLIIAFVMLCTAAFYTIKYRKQGTSTKFMASSIVANLLVFYICYIGKLMFDIYFQSM